MFRVVARTADGRSIELSVCASTEKEARAIVLGQAEIVTIDRVTPAPAGPPSTGFGRRAATMAVCLLSVSLTPFAAVLGGWMGHLIDQDSTDVLRTRWLVGGIVGGIIGVIGGVCILVKFLRR